MFAFEYYPTGDYISVYFDLKHYYFDYNEIDRIISTCRIKSETHLKRVRKLKGIKFLSPQRTLKLLDLYNDTEALKTFIIEQLLPLIDNFNKRYCNEGK